MGRLFENVTPVYSCNMGLFENATLVSSCNREVVWECYTDVHILDLDLSLIGCQGGILEFSVLELRYIGKGQFPAGLSPKIGSHSPN